MAKKDIQKMSAEELYALAQKKEKEEEASQREAAKAQLGKLRAERKELLAKHRKELAAMDAKIRAHGGRTGGTAGKGRQTGASALILKLLAGGEMDTKSIRKKLEKQGVAVSNLGQTMAYLKRSGKVKSVARGIYQLA